MNDSSFDLLITNEEYRSLENKLKENDKEICELRKLITEKEAAFIDVVNQLNASKEMVKKLSQDALRVSMKYISEKEEK